jgi:hypothetical protein
MAASERQEKEKHGHGEKREGEKKRLMPWKTKRNKKQCHGEGKKIEDRREKSRETNLELTVTLFTTEVFGMHALAVKSDVFANDRLFTLSTNAH